MLAPEQGSVLFSLHELILVIDGVVRVGEKKGAVTVKRDATAALKSDVPAIYTGEETELALGPNTRIVKISDSWAV